MAGRPTKYNDDVSKRIANAISVGATKRLAAAMGGINITTLLDWEQGKGGIPKSAFREFRQRLDEAEAHAAMRKLARIENAGREGDWRADAWWLERRLPDEYGKSVADIRFSGGIEIREYGDIPPETP
jgi:hypothetical protein